MSPSAKRILPFVALTLIYWPVALFLLGASQMGDCYIDGLKCEKGRAVVFWRILAVEVIMFAGAAYVLARLPRPGFLSR